MPARTSAPRTIPGPTRAKAGEGFTAGQTGT